MKKLLNLMLVFFSLFIAGFGNKRVDYDVTVYYKYVNTLNGAIKMKVANSLTKTIRKHYIINSINSGDSIEVKEVDMGIAHPFTTSAMADSVIIEFADGKCISYPRIFNHGRNAGPGVFNLQNYEGYEKLNIRMSTYRLVYKINEKDYDKAIPCL